MKTPKVNRVQNVRDFLKQKERIAQENILQKQEERFKAYLAKTAKSMLPADFRVKLNVIDADAFTHQKSVSTIVSENMSTKSVWAPWSPMARD